ncbi:MAG: hypothetical protein R3E89_11175 [Thiolinea sp.]
MAVEMMAKGNVFGDADAAQIGAFGITVLQEFVAEPGIGLDMSGRRN